MNGDQILDALMGIVNSTSLKELPVEYKVKIRNLLAILELNTRK